MEHAKRAIARVRVGADTRHGTAFCIGPGHMLTALHVVADTTQSPPRFLGAVQLQFPGVVQPVAASVVPDFFSVEGDWAVLACTPPPGVEPLLPTTDMATLAGDAAWRSFGYPDIETTGLTIGGTVRDAQAGAAAHGGLLQLFCDEVGSGTPLHGFSGAPCLVGAHVAGILRRTPYRLVTDGLGQTQVRTEASTVFATPSAQLEHWQAARGLALLPPPWGPVPNSDKLLTGADFVVVLSSQEPVADGERLALRDVAQRAWESLPSGSIAAPHVVHAERLVASPAAMQACIAALCRARVVVFDASGWEPAVMFLAGIRAVCRRGVTLLSVGGDCVLGDELGVPHNIKDANLVVHSHRQGQPSGDDSVSMLEGRLQRGLADVGSPLYLDLPVYDALRQLPPERRGTIADEEGVLVLCAFRSHQQAFWKDRLKPALQHQLKLLRQQRRLDGAGSVGAARSFELNSPRLVTQAVYEAIRRMQTCVIDLTAWSPNVLFELGVRLAASGQRSVCIIDSDWLATLPLQLAPQCHSLATLLLTADFQYRAGGSWQGQDVFANAYGLKAKAPPPLLQGAAVHTQVEQALDVQMEPAARPVYTELLAQAELFSRGPGVAGRSKPVGLFPGNRQLTQREEEADFERLVAAWLYLAHRYSHAELRASDSLRQGVAAASTALFARHAGRLGSLATELSALSATLEQTAAAAPVGGAPVSTLDSARALKGQATAERNRGQHALALQHLDSAAALLRARLPAATDERETQSLLGELADTLGMQGGVYRRLGDLRSALIAYTAGERIESQVGSSTYNLGNTIALRMAVDGVPVQDPQLHSDLDRAIAVLDRAVHGARCDEWWAWSDLGMFHLLAGHAEQAQAAYSTGRRQAGPSAEELQRHAASLRELAVLTLATAPAIAASLEAAAAALSL